MMNDVSESVSSYFDALNGIDRAAFLSCFADDAVARDPYGGPVFEGHAGLNKFFDGLERTWAEFHMAPQAAYKGANRVAVPWTTKAVARNGKHAEFSGINVFTLDGSGQIAELEAYWDFKAMLAQIRE